MYYHTLNEELRRRFGCKVYKLALDGGFTCPNRDGTIGARGCIFCAGDGSGAFAADRALDIPQQIEAAKVRVAGKNGGGKYIAYFQNLTNTYGSLARMEQLFTQALAPEDVVALSVATRPDCLPDAVIALLQRLNTEKPVWVELGLQTIHPQSAAYIRRGYDLPVFDGAVRRLRAAGLEVIVHQILGLPGETDAQMVQTARYIGQSGAQGIKLHLLHVLRGTLPTPAPSVTSSRRSGARTKSACSMRSTQLSRATIWCRGRNCNVISGTDYEKRNRFYSWNMRILQANGFGISRRSKR